MENDSETLEEQNPQILQSKGPPDSTKGSSFYQENLGKTQQNQLLYDYSLKFYAQQEHQQQTDKILDDYMKIQTERLKLETQQQSCLDTLKRNSKPQDLTQTVNENKSQNFVQKNEEMIFAKIINLHQDSFLLEDHFVGFNNQSYVMSLFRNQIICSKNNSKIGSLELDQQTRLQIVYEHEQIIALILDREGMYFSIKSTQKIMKAWRYILITILYQRSFAYNFTSKNHLLGTGNYAQVFKYQSVFDSKNYAVKIFKKDNRNYTGTSENLLKVCQNEIKMLRKLDHPNILKLYEVYEDYNNVYLVMEYIKGGSLQSKLFDYKQKNFKSSEIQQILRGIIDGLAYLQDKNIVHADIKPENILFRDTKGFNAVLCDFGFSSKLDENILFDRCGTTGFLAPELLINRQISNDIVSCKTDMFSLGVILYKLMVNQYPFQMIHSNQIDAYQNMKGIIDFQLNNFQQKNTLIQDICILMTKKDPKERITAKEAQTHLFMKEENDISKRKESALQIAVNLLKLKIENIMLFSQNQIQLLQLQQQQQKKQTSKKLKKLNANSTPFNPSFK